MFKFVFWMHMYGPRAGVIKFTVLHFCPTAEQLIFDLLLFNEFTVSGGGGKSNTTRSNKIWIRPLKAKVEG